MGKKGYVSPIAIHPGETLRENLELLEIPQKDFAIRTGLREETISRIIQGKAPITLESALKFERVLGISKDFWVKFQAGYDADRLRLKEQKRIVAEVNYLQEYTCYPELVKLGYVKKLGKLSEKVEELRRFFSVDSLSFVQDAMPVAFRKSNKKPINHESLAAWLRIGLIEAAKREVSAFDKEKLIANIAKMRKLTKEEPKLYSAKLIDLCAKCGVVLVYAPALKSTHVNGATRWISPNKALVQLSLRYSYADVFWFTFFHELGHIMKHRKKDQFIDLENEKVSLYEEEANLFAQKNLIPNQKDYKKLMLQISDENWKNHLTNFAEKINIDAGIVAGRLARETGDWARFSSFRKRLQFSS